MHCRTRLNETIFFYDKMQENFKNSKHFLYYLDAFLAFARSVPHVFKAEFNDNYELIAYYKAKTKEWQSNKIMKFFVEMRNISLKVHTPKMRITVAKSFTVSANIVDKFSLTKLSPNGEEEKMNLQSEDTAKSKDHKIEQNSNKDGVVAYSFEEVPDWFDLTPNVMALSNAYLKELILFVEQAETLLKKQLTK